MKNPSLSVVSSSRLARSLDLESVPQVPVAPRRPARRRHEPSARRAHQRRLFQELRRASLAGRLGPAWAGEAYRAHTGRWPRGLRTNVEQP